VGTIKYRPEIDGLRALAVIPVILFHAIPGCLPGGFIGVDVFFVISGYLITSVILKDFDRGHFRLSEFWLRRVRRILPVLITMVLSTALVGFFVLFGGALNNLGSQGTAALLSYANVNLWSYTGNYWGPLAENSPLLHTWSLSVEEQFYLFFPFLSLLLLKHRRSLFIPVLFALSTASFSLFLYGSMYHPTAAFYLLPTRAWEIGCGCLLAALVNAGKFKLSGNLLLSSSGILAVLLSFFIISGEGGISALLLIPVIGTVILIAFSDSENNPVRNILSFAPFVFIGKISYSLYIWHWPVLVLSKNMKTGISANSLLLFQLLFLIFISIISYYLIEKRTRRNPKSSPYILLALLISVVFTTWLAKAEFSEDLSAFNPTTWRGQLYNTAPNQEWPASIVKRMQGVSATTNKDLDCNSHANGGIIKLYGGDVPELVVLGDSHGLMWSGVIDEICAELKISVSFYAADGTPAFISIPVQKKKSNEFFSSEEIYTYDKMRLAFLEEWKPKAVIIITRWSNIENIDIAQDLLEFINKLGAEVILIEQPPELYFGEYNAPQFLAYLDLKPADNSNKYINDLNSAQYQNGRALIREISSRYSFCNYVPIRDIFIKNNKVWVIDNFNVLYIDDDHLSQQGALKVKPVIFKCLNDLFP
jgi:peptidoglycan/LPS O-acetylase OafA/YrhL